MPTGIYLHKKGFNRRGILKDNWICQNCGNSIKGKFFWKKICSECKKKYFKNYYENNKEKFIEPAKLRSRKSRLKCLNHYSNGKYKCDCCGEKEIKFLTIDHINNDGTKHRKEIGQNITFWLIKNNFPKGFQILCYNCNNAKRIYGKCPHYL